VRRKRYLSRTPKKEYPEGVRLVHNFCPGPPNDPGADRMVGAGGFRIWVTDETDEDVAADPKRLPVSRCYCGWLDGREHYGTRGYVEANGQRYWSGEPVESEVRA
jgi:hypothetical protein